jgi:hypothetical protein
VLQWRETLSQKQRQEWVTPRTIKKQFDAAREIEKQKKAGIERTSPFAVQKAALIAAEDQVAELTKKLQLASRDDDSLFNLARDTPDNIAQTITGNVTENKARQIYAALNRAIKAKWDKKHAG